MQERHSRTIKLIGREAMEKLANASVLIIGIGGVGSFAAEAIARSGVGRIALMDGDDVSESNLNRQLVALKSTLGKNKAKVMADRIRDIDSNIEVESLPRFYKSGDKIDLTRFDWIIDAIDSVDAKTDLIVRANELGVNIVSSMGAAGKLGTKFIQEDISKTTVCPLAKIMRKKLREKGIESLPVVFSDEKPIAMEGQLGTISYVPPSAGLEIAGYVIRQIIAKQ
ncbi:MAG: tRNA threonylcarbamoyladenosine dehydratase [Clostridiales bacterium]|nr:tRNA threonylcarbamoyladenosine dehydratase [Clostridiales bacterium]